VGQTIVFCGLPWLRSSHTLEVPAKFGSANCGAVNLGRSRLLGGSFRMRMNSRTKPKPAESRLQPGLAAPRLPRQQASNLSFNFASTSLAS
jgi:hypothetical protein